MRATSQPFVIANALQLKCYVSMQETGFHDLRYAYLISYEGATLGNFRPYTTKNIKRQANRNCAVALLICLIFVTLPSVGIGVLRILGLVVAILGPFYLIALLCAGVCNGSPYGSKQRYENFAGQLHSKGPNYNSKPC
ncbi:hypothetical protein KIN20_019320 [Parelaphostrongylus tenuis]|uniref:Uncharacterized protein n=1 Tax=Parelaphostrongylus tenuis TaxID=148309 RepID=A0AAD5N302_PARTN|nr:hypothetical protein KIN20_019320 [Parelaphostrongylus tenuis]